MKKNHFKYIIYIVIAIVIAIGVRIIFLSRIPEGVPNNYFSRIQVLEDNDVQLYVFSDVINFNNDYEYTYINHTYEINETEKTYKNVLIIDMNKYLVDPFINEEELLNLYNVELFTIVIVNYYSSHSNQLTDFVNVLDRDSDCIFYSYTINYVKTTGSVSGEIPTNQMLMYAILDNLAYIMEENKY